MMTIGLCPLSIMSIVNGVRSVHYTWFKVPDYVVLSAQMCKHL